MIKEENVLILDFLQHGYPLDNTPAYRRNPIAQAVGKTNFILLELVPKREIFLQPNEEVYIGDGKRDKVHHVIGRIPYDKLTATAQAELDELLILLVRKSEAKFVDFFNKAGPISTRMHQLELLPGVGKKHMWEILERREEEEFKDFGDIKKRVKLMPDPEKTVKRRILAELNNEDRYFLFVGHQ
jgi:putative nucleotide binding protein